MGTLKKKGPNLGRISRKHLAMWKVILFNKRFAKKAVEQ